MILSVRFNDRGPLIAIAVVAVMFFSVVFGVSAQQKEPRQSKCPVVKVTCPDMVYVGGKLTFTADVKGGDPDVTPTYNWTVSASSIESGQGTSTIEVNTTDVSADMTATATVDVGGFDRECDASASCTVSIIKKAEARKLDEYGKLTPEEEDARLDNLVIEVNQDPTAEVYIISYSGRASRPGDAKKAAGKVKDYLVKKRGLEAGRVVIVEGGYRQQPVTELWVVPSGAEPPKATPTIKGTDAKPAGPDGSKASKSKKG